MTYRYSHSPSKKHVHVQYGDTTLLSRSPYGPHHKPITQMLTLHILVTTPTQPVFKVNWPSPTIHQLIFSGNYEGFVQIRQPLPAQRTAKKPAPEKFDSLNIICSYRAISTCWLFNHLVQYGLTFPSTVFNIDYVYVANQTAGMPDLELYLELYWYIYTTHMSLFWDIKSNFPPHDSMYNVELASNTQVFKHLSANAAPPPIIPKPVNMHMHVTVPVVKGIDKHGKPILFQGDRTVCNFNHSDSNLSLAHPRCPWPLWKCSCQKQPHNQTMPTDGLAQQLR